MSRIRYSDVRSVAPAFEPITLDEAKGQAVIEGAEAEDDARLAGYLVTIRDIVEAKLGVALVTQTRVLRLDRFPACEILIPRPPLASIASIQYVDSNGTTQTLSSSNYVVHVNGQPVGYVVPAWGLAWPSTRAVPEAVIITYVAGKTTRGDVHTAIRQTMLSAITALNENREGSPEDIVGELVAPLASEHGCTWEPEYE